MLESRARRIPLVTNDSQTDRSHVLSVITQYRILKFVAVNVSDTQKLRRPLGELLLGTYDNIATASMDTPVIDVIHILVERSISSMPILNSEGMFMGSTYFRGGFKIDFQALISLHIGVVYNVFESVDVIALIRGGVYDDLSLTVGEVLKKRSPVCRSLCFFPFKVSMAIRVQFCSRESRNSRVFTPAHSTTDWIPSSTRSASPASIV